jgi:sRNA-binding regulator protein Hfq
MTQKQQSLIDDFLNVLSEDDKHVFEVIINSIAILGYIPQKQKVKDFVLSFKHGQNGKIIAKMGIRKQKGFLSIKFFACKNVPKKYIAALGENADDAYARLTPPERDQLRPNEIMLKCTLSCGICTGGKMRYYHQYPNGKEIYRCGAYPVLLPDITVDDVEDLKRLISEQHSYFLSIA